MVEDGRLVMAIVNKMPSLYYPLAALQSLRNHMHRLAMRPLFSQHVVLSILWGGLVGHLQDGFAAGAEVCCMTKALAVVTLQCSTALASIAFSLPVSIAAFRITKCPHSL